MQKISDDLISYSQKDYYPFHMPGHKRNSFSVKYQPSIETDITEIDGFDNLHHTTGILKEAQQRAADLFHAQETLYSVNGSTAALLSAVSACTTPGGRILMARNCHKSVYHGVYLRQLNPVYVYPTPEKKYRLNGGISPSQVKNLLEEHEDIQAVIITSPTYDGVVSPVRQISEIVHEYNIPLIVDEAHGAHMCFHSNFPQSALSQGADIVIHSLHKTLPSMTQTALLHRNSQRVSSELLHRYMGMYQSSSPSYPLMASIDACVSDLMEEGEKRFQEYVGYLKSFQSEMEKTKVIHLVTDKIKGQADIYDWDSSKIILSLEDCPMTGKEFYNILLDKYHLQMEMGSNSYVLGITSIGDTPLGFKRLAQAVLEIDTKLKGYSQPQSFSPATIRLHQVVPLYEAMNAHNVYMASEETAGKICGEFISLYPPGIPLIVPGEIISKELLEYIACCVSQGLEIHGLDGENRIGVIHE